MTIQPINDRVPIINADGTPTQFFLRQLQERGITVDGKITAEEAQVLIEEWAAQRDINVTSPITGGGNLSNDITIGMANSGVTPGSYTNTNLTVDAFGRITAASNGSSVSGAAWRLVDQSGAPTTSPTWTWSTNVSNVDVTGLGSYNELLIVARNVGSTSGGTGVRSIVVSVNGGSTFYTASGDYVLVSTLGVESNDTQFLYHNTGSGSARTLQGGMQLKGPIKQGWSAATTRDRLFVASALDINAIRFANINSGTISGQLTSGNLYVYAR